MSLLKNRNLLLVKKEVTNNVDPTPTTAANGILVENMKVAWPTEVADRPAVDISLSPHQPLHARKYAKFDFDVELKGSGTAGTAPDLGPLLELCGFGETIVSETSVTYAPISTGFASAYMYNYFDGLLYKMGGAIGNPVLKLPAGQRPMLGLSCMGHAVSALDAAFPSSVTLDSTLPQIVKGSTFTMGGYAAEIASLDMDMQNNIVIPDSVNAADGYGQAQITGRNPSGSFDPEAVLVATNDYWSHWEDGTTKALSIVIGATAGNIMTITAPAVTYRELNQTDREGLLTYEIPFTLARSAGDDEISIAFT